MNYQKWVNHGHNAFLWTKQLSVIFIERCKEDNISVSSGHLAYVTLLSLVPFVMVIFTIMSAFPAFENVRSNLETFVYTNLVPTVSEVVKQYMSKFVLNASKMSAIGILSLLAVALMLILNVDKTLNRIWRSQKRRPVVYTFAIYWMVITLGPLLIGTSVIVSSYLTGWASITDEYNLGFATFLLSFVPSFAAMLVFSVLYMVVPNCKVPTLHALAGGALATLAFELTKFVFALYMTNFPSYELIYGALAVVPILFLWVYLSWNIVLFGAVFTCSLTQLAQKDRVMPDDVDTSTSEIELYD